MSDKNKEEKPQDNPTPKDIREPKPPADNPLDHGFPPSPIRIIPEPEETPEPPAPDNPPVEEPEKE